MTRILFSLICLFPILQNSTAEASALGLVSGSIKVISKDNEVCADGPYRLMGEKSDQVLMVGPNITFYPPQKEKQILSTSSLASCAEDVASLVKENNLINIFTTHSCPKKLKHLERVVTETLSASKDKTLTYTKVSPGEKKIKCVFKWESNEKE